MLGLGIYWGEGAKTTKRLWLCNNDPKLIKAWLAWCAHYLPTVEQYGQVYAHADVNGKMARRYWARLTGIRIRKKVVVTKSRKHPGETRISVRGTLRVCAGVGSAEWFVKTLYWISKL